jgi:mannose-6-phosphate isomerase
VTDAVVPATEAISRTAQQCRDWLLNHAAPLWSERGRSGAALFPERISLSGKADASYFRTFVQARHIFSFVTIGTLGWSGPWRELVSQTVDLLIGRAKRDDGLFVHRLNASAAPLDRRVDLYDQAFMLFALASAGKALDRTELFDEAEALLQALEREWSHRTGGFREGEIADAGIRRQNPHMHLLEAAMALHEASGRERFGALAESIAHLASTRFIDKPTGALLEYFTDNWAPAPGVDGRIVEPGHCLEWAWLFERRAAAGAAGATEVSDRLTAFARRHGLDPVRGVAINEVLTSGDVHDGKARLWPQTERLKAALARFRRLGTDGEAREAIAAAKGLAQYLQVDVQGLWRDKLQEDGSWIDEMAPGSSLYHISCAYAEFHAGALQFRASNAVA